MLERILTLLTRNEWSNGVCPECGNMFRKGHKAGCEHKALMVELAYFLNPPKNSL